MTDQQSESIYTDANPVIGQGRGPYSVIQCFLKEPRIDDAGLEVKYDEFFYAELESLVTERDPDHAGPGTELRIKPGTDPVLVQAYTIFLAEVMKPVARAAAPEPA